MDYSYQSNTHKNEQDNTPAQREVESVVTNEVKVRKRNQGILGAIFKQDFRDIRKGLIDDYIYPKVQDLIFEAIDGGVETVKTAFELMIYDGAKHTTKNRTNESYSYNSCSRSTRKPASSYSSAGSYSLDDIEYATRGEAEVVLEKMLNDLAVYPSVRVADLYGYSGIKARYTDNDYGWTDLSGVSVMRTRGGWILDLPKPRALN